MKRYKAVLKEAEASLSVSGQETRVAAIVMEELFGLNFAGLMVHGDELMSKEDYKNSFPLSNVSVRMNPTSTCSEKRIFTILILKLPRIR